MPTVTALLKTLGRKGMLPLWWRLKGCSESEIAQVQAQHEEPLPAAYREFLKVAGKSAGEFFQGSDAFFPTVLELKTWAVELLEELGQVDGFPARGPVIFMHQGYVFAQCMDYTDDPPVILVQEGRPWVQWPTFTNWLALEIDAQVGLVRSSGRR